MCLVGKLPSFGGQAALNEVALFLFHLWLPQWSDPNQLYTVYTWQV